MDIQAKLQPGKVPGYARWAKVFNLKQMAQTVNFLTEHHLLDYTELEEKAVAATAHHNELSAQIKATEKRMGRDRRPGVPISLIMPRPARPMLPIARPVIPENFGRNMSKKFCSIRRQKMPLMMGVKKLPPRSKTCNLSMPNCWREKKKTYAEYRRSREEMRGNF